jgi:hypothetical protein
MTKRKRERKGTMTTQQFIEANEDQFIVDYLESNPERWYQVNDWELDHFYEWMNSRMDYVMDIMMNEYEDFLLIN